MSRGLSGSQLTKRASEAHTNLRVECGNMLIMTLAYTQRTQDTAYLSTHYKILNQWAQYLIQEALIPSNQISTDDFAGSLANQTDLALKGIIGIEAIFHRQPDREHR